MTLHLTKVAVGCSTLAQLATRQTARQGQRADGSPTVICQTRHAPRRAEELAGGSLYWIVKHHLVARQAILGIDMADTDRGRRCHIHLDPRLVPVLSAPLRAHQGWRYLEAGRAPPDLADMAGDISVLPAALLRELRALALI